MNQDDFIEIERIVKVVTERLNVTNAQLISEMKINKVVRARYYIAFLAAQNTSVPITYVARRLRKTHSTLLHGKRKVMDEIELYPEVKKELRYLQDDLDYEPEDARLQKIAELERRVSDLEERLKNYRG
mgnify:CR=1 FL=1